GGARSTSNATDESTTTSACGICGTWSPGTRAGLMAPGRRPHPNRSPFKHSALGLPGCPTDEVFGPDRLVFARFDASYGVRHGFQSRPQRRVEFAAHTDWNRTRLVENQVREPDGTQQLGQRIRREDGHVRQVAVDHLARKQA